MFLLFIEFLYFACQKMEGLGKMTDKVFYGLKSTPWSESIDSNAQNMLLWYMFATYLNFKKVFGKTL